MTPTVATIERQVPTIAKMSKMSIFANESNINHEPRKATINQTYRYQGSGDRKHFENWKENPNQLPVMMRLSHGNRAATLWLVVITTHRTLRLPDNRSMGAKYLKKLAFLQTKTP
jgi:hypothetical protein